MGLFDLGWKTIDANDNTSREYYFIKNSLERRTNKKLAEIVINSLNKYVCKGAVFELAFYRKEIQSAESLLNVIKNAKFANVRLIAAVEYSICFKIRQ